MCVLVTGGTRGIGNAIAEELLSAGTPVIVVGRGAVSVERRASALSETYGHAAWGLAADLADPEQAHDLVDRAIKLAGTLTGVVLGAGVAHGSPLEEQSLQDWQTMFDVNVRAAWLVATRALPHLAQNSGAIVALGSISGRAPHPGMGGYSVSKAALAMLIRQMALEWGPRGVRVNLVSPGFTRTERTDGAVYVDPDRLQGRIAMTALGRLADPRLDMAGVVRFLLNQEARYITGQEIVVDGGVADGVFTRDPGAAGYQRSSR